ncbi:MAG: hypothetical protein ABIG20_00260 [archaeon]
MVISPYGSEREYTDCINRLSTLSANFLDDLKAKGIKLMSSSYKGRQDEILDLVAATELKQVSDLETPMLTFNEELSKMARRFHVMKKSYAGNAPLSEIMKSYKENPGATYRNLLSSIDMSLAQLDSLITAYSRIDQRKRPAKQWILTILSHQATDKSIGKARRANEILSKLNLLIEDTREICHSTKLELLDVRNIASKYAAQETKST